jgi:hypothetical protein
LTHDFFQKQFLCIQIFCKLEIHAEMPFFILLLLKQKVVGKPKQTLTKPKLPISKGQREHHTDVTAIAVRSVPRTPQKYLRVRSALSVAVQPLGLFLKSPCTHITPSSAASKDGLACGH